MHDTIILINKVRTFIVGKNIKTFYNMNIIYNRYVHKKSVYI